MSADKLVLTAAEAAAVLGVSRSTVQRLTAAGWLRTLPGFTERRYGRAELQRYAAGTEAPIRSVAS
jgi:excisionase family DNA binding protein